MTSPVSDGGFPAPDFLGWAFTTLGKFDFSGSPGDNLIVPLIVIALLIWPTLWLFSTLQRIRSQRNQVIIVFGLLAIVVLLNVFLIQLKSLLQFEPLAILFYLFLWYGINNFIFWAGAIILPTYYVYPEIRRRNLRRVVAVCFFLTGIFRYGSEYLISFTPVSGLYYALQKLWPAFAAYNLVMIPVTIGFAFFSYWLIHGILQRVPLVRRLLDAGDS